MTPPVTTATITLVPGGRQVKLHSTDTQCIPTIWYRIDCNDALVGGSSDATITLKDTESLEYWAEDLTRNAETHHRIEAKTRHALASVIDTISASIVTAGDPVRFSGHGSDPVGHSLAVYQWSSSRDGLLSTARSFSTSSLTPGVHQIRFVVECCAGLWSPWNVATLTVSPAPVVTPTTARVPSASRVTYYRKSGVARYRLDVTVKGRSGRPLVGHAVYLQTSTNGKTAWRRAYTLKATSAGKASKTFVVRTKGTRYYRWYIPAVTGLNRSKATGTQTIVVK